jgi:hypothetical protein
VTTFEEKKAELAEYLDEGDRAVEEHSGFKFGDRVRVIEDSDDPDSVYAGDEGLLIIEKVGAEQYANVRVGLFIVEPGVRDVVEVDPANIEAA